MKLDSSFIRLPYRFDPKPVLEQINILDDEAWRPHPRGWEGHEVIPLVSAEGGDDLARLEGEMRPTRWLEELSTVRHLLGMLDTVIGRTMLVRGKAGKDAQKLVDAGSYWHRRARVFMPLVGDDSVRWQCGEEEAAIPNGQAWLVDGWQG